MTITGIVANTVTYDLRFSLAGTSLNAIGPWLFVLHLLPFGWLLLESRTIRSTAPATN